MKIRIKGNSLRYRLTRSEVAKFWENGILEEHTQFAHSKYIDICGSKHRHCIKSRVQQPYQ